MNSTSRIAVVALLAAFAGCSHSHPFTQDPEIAQLGASPLAGKRLLLGLDGVPEVHDDSAGGHSFHVTGIRDSVRVILTKMYGDQQVVGSPPADATIDVDLTFAMSGTMLGTSATCSATCTILDPEGNPLGSGQAERESSHPTMANGGRNCELAMLMALPVALDQAMAGMR